MTRTRISALVAIAARKAQVAASRSAPIHADEIGAPKPAAIYAYNGAGDRIALV